jgi:hypothetical protein
VESVTLTHRGLGGSGCAARGGGRGRDGTVLLILDAELGRVLVLAGALDNKHQTVVSGVRLQFLAGGPVEVAAVVNGLGQGVDGLDVAGGAAEQNQGDGALGGRLPLNGVGLASGHHVVETRLGDGIARGGLVVVRLRVGRGQGGHGREDGSLDEEHCDSGLSTAKSTK